MTNQEILRHVDHTLLAPTATWEEIAALCGDAIRYETASVCIPPCYVRRAAESCGSALPVGTVLGFPLGYDTTEAKLAAARNAVQNGARELDMVINLGDVKNGDFSAVTAEIRAMKQAAGENLLKVIVETCYLTQDEKIRLCGCVTEAGADYIKTSTGFGTAGAALDDVLLFRRHIGPRVKIKAAGGIRTREDMVAFLQAGCSRLGTSSALTILRGDAPGAY